MIAIWTNDDRFRRSMEETTRELEKELEADEPEAEAEDWPPKPAASDATAAWPPVMEPEASEPEANDEQDFTAVWKPLSEEQSAQLSGCDSDSIPEESEKPDPGDTRFFGSLDDSEPIPPEEPSEAEEPFDWNLDIDLSDEPEELPPEDIGTASASEADPALWPPVTNGDGDDADSLWPEDPGQPLTDAEKAAAFPEKRKKLIMTVISAAAAVLLLLVGAGTWWYLSYTGDDGLIYPNVYALGVNLGGMTREEAASTLHSATEHTYSEQTLQISLPGETLLLTPDTVRIHVDVERVAGEAFAHGREGSRWQRTKARQAAEQTKFTLPVADCMSVNTDGIRQLLEATAKSAESALTQTTVQVEGTVPELNRLYAEAAADKTVEHMVMTIVVGTPARKLDVDALMTQVLERYYENSFVPIEAAYEQTDPDALDLEELFRLYCVAGIDASVDETTYAVTPEVLGYGFKAEELSAVLAAAKPGETITYPLGYLEPAVTRESLEKVLFRDTLSQVDTDHIWNPARTQNLVLACQAINGKVLKPGDTFSFNDTVGERTAEKGYQAGTVFSGGHSVKEIGGGVCQVASSIYYAALQADMEIVQRSEHGFTVDYVPLGMDAAIYWPSLDLKFRNNTTYPIRIDASVSDGKVHIRIIGTDDKDYTVRMEYEITDGPHKAGTRYQVYAGDNPDGYRDGQVLQTPYDGLSVTSYRVRCSKITGEVLSREVETYSTYSKRDELICIIGDPTAPTDPDGRPIETEKPTEVPTEKPTVPPTEKPTEKPTEPPTEKPTEKPTEPPTEKPTEKPTVPPTEPSTEPPTEPSTEPPTEPPTEVPPEPPTEIPTDPAPAEPAPDQESAPAA